MSFISSTQILYIVSHAFLLTWIDASVAETTTFNLKGTKKILAKGFSKFFINGKLTEVNGLRKLRNPPTWFAIFLIVPFDNIPLFSKKLFFYNIFISLC